MTDKKTKTVLAWHFLALPAEGTGPRLPHGDNRVVRVGEALTVDPPIVLCERGLHASRRPIDALSYAPGPLVCRVRLSGEIVEGDDKLAASSRTVAWMADATRTLHEFAVWCAREALLRERQAGREPDPRCWAALEVKERWLNGLATTEELAAASAAARAASWAASSAAAWDAASAAAWDAAWDAQNKRLESMLNALRGKRVRRTP